MHNLSSLKTKAFLFAILVPIFTFAFLYKPAKIDTANFTSASVTLSNSRLSFLGRLVIAGAGTTAVVGTDTFVLKTVGGTSAPDGNNRHLFVKDTISIGTANSGPNALVVDNAIGTTAFNTFTGIAVTVAEGDPVFVVQRTGFIISADIASTIPANGYVKIFIPAVSTGSNQGDGIPDSNTSAASNGWDSYGIGKTADFQISGGVGCTWSNPAWTAGTSSAAHTVQFTTSTACGSGTLSINIGNTGTNLGVGITGRFINPAGILGAGNTHNTGIGDTYRLTLTSYDTSASQIDTVDMMFAPIEGVRVSATVDETLTMTVVGKAAGSTACGQIQNSGITTTSYSVPWGTIVTPNSFLNAGQGITISTNAAGGYSVKIEENDQMGKDGVACSGATAGESVNCIKDTTCDGGLCTESTGKSWGTGSTNGLGYSLESVSGTTAAFSYGSGLGTAITARQFADQESSEARQNILSWTASGGAGVSGDSINVCYRISVSATQPAGVYYNTVKYTTVPIF